MSFSREAFWHSRITAALSALPLKHNDLQVCDALFYSDCVPDYLPYSNRYVRSSSRHAFWEVLGDYWDSHPSDRLYLVTFAGARGVGDLRAPSFDWAVFQRVVDAALRHRNLSGVMSGKFDVVKPQARGGEYLILTHFHGVVRANNGRIRLKDVKASLAHSPAFPGWNGTTGAHIKRIRQSRGDIERVAVYLADPFHQLKRIQPHRRIPGRYILRSTRDGLSNAIALRAGELQSRLGVRDLVFGVGEFGCSVRSEWWARMSRTLSQRDEGITPMTVEQFWRHLYQQLPAASGWSIPRFDTRSTRYRGQHE